MDQGRQEVIQVTNGPAKAGPFVYARKKRQPRLTLSKIGVSDGTRTRDFLDHNQVLYQLSYTHHALVRREYRSVSRTALEIQGVRNTRSAAARASSLVGPGWGTKAVLR
jgi:hypothetical protein